MGMCWRWHYLTWSLSYLFVECSADVRPMQKTLTRAMWMLCATESNFKKSINLKSSLWKRTKNKASLSFRWTIWNKSNKWRANRLRRYQVEHLDVGPAERAHQLGDTMEISNRHQNDRATDLYDEYGMIFGRVKLIGSNWKIVRHRCWSSVKANGHL